jgi:hypothetical protein
MLMMPSASQPVLQNLSCESYLCLSQRCGNVVGIGRVSFAAGKAHLS